MKMREREVTIHLRLPGSPRKRWLLGGIVASVGLGAIAYATVPNVFNAGDPLSATKVNANFTSLDTRVTKLEQPAYKVVSNSGQVAVPVSPGNANILTASFTPTGSGIVQVSATGQAAFYFHTNSTNQLPDRWRCCLSASGQNACEDLDVAATWPPEGGGQMGSNIYFTMSYPFTYAGSGAFSVTLNCSVPSGFAPPANGSVYGYVSASAMTAVFMPSTAM
jgi:hypothetical protein